MRSPEPPPAEAAGEPVDTTTATVAIARSYPIGAPGAPWGEAERAAWCGSRVVRRSYRDEVLAKIEALGAPFERVRYGALDVDPERYPLVALRCDAAGRGAPWVLVTGGVHGYETSGVQGALAFARTLAPAYLDRVNLLVAPCVSPWAYERVERWNPHAVDPNRSFVERSPAQESAALMALLAQVDGGFLLHLDLHETTDSDEQEFRPALAARDGKAFEPGSIPDGFYLVADAERPAPELQAAIIAAVREVTHIAPAGPDGTIIGCEVKQPGVIEYRVRELGLCAGVTRAPFTSTTEVYPDSPRATPDVCNAAQVAALRGALDHVLEGDGSNFRDFRRPRAGQ